MFVLLMKQRTKIQDITSKKHTMLKNTKEPRFSGASIIIFWTESR